MPAFNNDYYNMFRWIKDKLVDKDDPNAQLKLGVWLYFFLLIFEGALRKWFLPFLATPLLIVRDPVALWLIFKLLNTNRFKGSIFLTICVIITVISIFTAVFFGHGNFFVAVYGARTFLIHFPMIFVIGTVFNRNDVLKLGKVFLYISIPMTVLVIMQFYSPQSAWVNRGVGGDVAGAGFNGANGYFRPPGTFSFTVGNSLFYSVVPCFLFYYWLTPTYFKRWILILATGCFIIAIPLSISRGLFFSAGVTAVFAMMAVSRKPQYLVKMLSVLVIGLVVGVILSQLSIFQNALEAFTARFTSASESEGGAIEGTLLNRYLGGLLDSFDGANNIPFWGIGIGALSNVGSTLLSGQIIKGLSEGEWGRIITEMGFIMGLIIILVRMLFSLQFVVECYKRLSAGDLLPWLLLSFVLLSLPQANWTQPSILGFSVFVAGLTMASLKVPVKKRVLSKVPTDFQNQV
jgi:hypothetical protein